MKIVLDTNVVVSGFLSPHHAPSRILQAVLTGGVTLLYDARILSEYREVLSRPRFNLAKAGVETFLQEIDETGQPVLAKAIDLRLPDPDDRPFVEVAVSGGADALVTGNLKHFSLIKPSILRVMSPTDFASKFLSA